MTDALLRLWVAATIHRARAGWLAGRGAPWRPGEPLRLLFAGYNGTRNTGSDVRVEELLRQVRAVLGADRVRCTVMTQDFDRTRGYFGDAEQVKLPDVFPAFLYRETARHHGVVACEGSMFKSRFANALTTMMAGSLALAAARNGLAVGYGAEAGAMDRGMRRFVARHCKEAFVLARSEESEAILRDLGVPCAPGTDTAWTFTPRPPEAGRDVLRRAGWDGRAPVLAVCPIHPFWWPVTPSLWKAAALRVAGAYRASHYRSIYFHRSGADVERRYARYLGALAGAVKAQAKARGLFPVLVAMERLDAGACERVAALLDGAPVLTSDRHDMYELVSVLRCCRAMVSSRYHGIVTSMPALVPSAGVTMDERIENLLRDRGHEALLMRVDDDDLEARTHDAIDALFRDADEIRAGIGRCVASHLRRMARMGADFGAAVQRVYPEFEIEGGSASWERWLPPLSPELERLVEAHGGVSA